MMRSSCRLRMMMACTDTDTRKSRSFAVHVCDSGRARQHGQSAVYRTAARNGPYETAAADEPNGKAAGSMKPLAHRWLLTQLRHCHHIVP